MKRLFAILLLLPIAALTMAQETDDEGFLIKITGYVRDEFSGSKIEDASISVPGTNIGTVTNEDGYFSLKLKTKPEYIQVTSIGYKTKNVDINDKLEGLRVNLTPTSMVLKELVVYSGEGRNLVRAALDKRHENNVQDTELLTSFYRETIQKGNRFIDISEAILQTYKRPYDYGIDYDKVKVVQGRRLISQRTKDTISVKVMGGPTLPITLDAVKNDVVLFDPVDWQADAYKYELDNESAVINDRAQLVINFTPAAEQPWALYYGKIYLDKQTLAITRLEFSLDMRDRAKAVKHMLYKKPNGLRFRPRELSTIVDYKNGRINYMKNTFRFSCDWKKRLFARSYTCVSEMVITDVEEDYKGPKIINKERFGERDTFNDAVEDFSDPDFWGDYNIIEPTESLERAVGRLKKTK
jgi:hypothetical protein